MPKKTKSEKPKPPVELLEAKIISGLKSTPVNQFAVFVAMSKPYCPHGWIAIHQAVAGGTPWFVDASQSDLHANLYQANGVN